MSALRRTSFVPLSCSNVANKWNTGESRREVTQGNACYRTNLTIPAYRQWDSENVNGKIVPRLVVNRKTAWLPGFNVVLQK
jgi:hypothetical protein